MDVDFLAGAKLYAKKLGWPVFLLAPMGKEPFIPKRHGGNGVHDATCDLEIIGGWGRLCPNGNIGLACGEKSGIIVLDADPRNGGDATIRGFAVKYSFPRGPRARTGNGGWHLFFRHQPGLAIRGKLGAGVDVKSTGGYIVAPPSFTGPSEAGPGGPYVWDVSPFDVPPPAMPAWLVEMLSPPRRNRPVPQDFGEDGDLAGALHFVAHSPEGNRNRGLYWAACRARELVESCAIGETEAICQLAKAANAAGLPEAQAMRTIMSGLKGRASGERRAR
jgi:hypothetical protein